MSPFALRSSSHPVAGLQQGLKQNAFSSKCLMMTNHTWARAHATLFGGNLWASSGHTLSTTASPPKLFHYGMIRTS